MPKTVGAKIDNMVKLDQKRTELNAEVKKLTDAYNELADALLEQMGKENMGTLASGTLGQVRITDSVVPTVKDWDEFYAFIHKHKYYHLLDRRPSVSGCRELFETKGKVPGVEPFVKIKLNLSVNKG